MTINQGIRKERRPLNQSQQEKYEEKREKQGWFVEFICLGETKVKGCFLYDITLTATR